MILSYIRADFISYCRLVIFKNKWRKRNKHNSTLPSVVFNMDTVSVGNYTYGGLCIKNYGDNSTKLKIGHFCSIAQNSEFCLAGEHSYHTVSTFPLEKYGFHSKDSEPLSKGDIILGDDVWIGERATILSGVKIGQGAIIGAGAIVAKDVPPYAIFVGSEVKNYRFSKDIIEKLCLLRYEKITPRELKEAQAYASTEEFINSELFKRMC